MRHFLSLFDIDATELESILSLGEQVKQLLQAGRRPNWLAGHVLALLFEKPSLRTRVSFEAGMEHLGGTALFLGQEVGWGSRESTADFIRVLAEYVDVVVCRARSHCSVQELASFDCVTVINGLTDWSHPCQALADLMTMRQEFSSLKDRQLTFVGDGNNVARSLALACSMVGMRFRLLGPSAYFMPADNLAKIREHYPQADLEQTENAHEAMDQADFVYTDVWTSMGQEAESQRRRKDFAPFQLNAELLAKAQGTCHILHCLPAKRGEEITDEVIDSPNSRVISQAGNRMHAQKGLLLWLAVQKNQLSKAALKEENIHLT